MTKVSFVGMVHGSVPQVNLDANGVTDAGVEIR